MDFTWSDERDALVFIQQFKKPDSVPELSADEFAAATEPYLQQDPERLIISAM